MAEYVDLSERVTATFYSDEYEEWTQQTVTIADVLDSVCDDYTVLPSIQAKRPEGEWEPLGHRMGVLKHPDSEDYKCSICGYESYTLYPLPPKTCPECGADMRESVKKLYDNIMSVPLPGWDENDG